MSDQITLSDQERDMLTQTAQTPTLSVQQVEHLVQFINELTERLRLTMPVKSPKGGRKPAKQQPLAQAKPSPEVLGEERATDEQNPLSIEELKIQGQQLEQLYALYNPEEIWDFLMMHQYLVPLLIKAHSSVRKYFPTNNLALRYVIDPEYPDAGDFVLFISYGPDWRKSSETLKKFEHEWWPIAGRQAEHDLCIMLGGI